MYRDDASGVAGGVLERHEDEKEAATALLYRGINLTHFGQVLPSLLTADRDDPWRASKTPQHAPHGFAGIQTDKSNGAPPRLVLLTVSTHSCVCIWTGDRVVYFQRQATRDQVVSPALSLVNVRTYHHMTDGNADGRADFISIVSTADRRMEKYGMTWDAT